MDQSIRLRRPDEVVSADECDLDNSAMRNFAFTTGSPDAIKSDFGDRRFAVVNLAEGE